MNLANAALSNPAHDEIGDQEFANLGRLIRHRVGLDLSPARKYLVTGRLGGRLRALNLRGYGDYLDLLENGCDEMQAAIDLLCTNETWFFREPEHFAFLRDHLLAGHNRATPPRIWSAACSSGEEPYSIAMTLAGRYPDTSWEVLASDISTKVLNIAKRGVYPLSRGENIPFPLLLEHCRKGIGSCQGTLSLTPQLRERVRFLQINLNEPLPELGSFDLIFLRNVMIYFDAPTKRRVLQRVIERLRPGGYLFVGHSEVLHGLTDAVRPVRPAIYRKP
ncbi:CheR family methyltransferase [Methylomagnum ishizawai]|uniref:CheR family methyltransferase n=1 Tax=Methylomagnum ishizawai TaxID=1760988 RepID=UPI001C32AB8A|nr:protein-glutamate O-methyltransferase CheR [Methylomagnum ishizawai]BBL76443.1 chemotaxis protein methyltransferase [Methylomagnum ishizawai]